MPNEFFRAIRAQIQDSWRRLIQRLLAILLAGVRCAIRYIYDGIFHAQILSVQTIISNYWLRLSMITIIKIIIIY